MVNITSAYTRLPGVCLKNHQFHVPLDYRKPSGEQIAIFAREVVSAGRENDDLPWLVFFQGGPGFGSPRPHGADAWLKRALKDYRVLLLDQRGTGLSSPILDETLVGSAQQQSAYLKHFRADNIVRDAEYIRKQLIGTSRWTALGQSYGGFCLVTYLSIASEGLEAAIITGGLPPLVNDPDEVYRRTYSRVVNKNRKYYERYPADVHLVRKIVDYLSSHDVYLPSQERLTPRRFLQLGLGFGASDGFESVHYLLEQAFCGSAVNIGYAFCRQFFGALQFDTNPIYSILHESIYCQGRASNWSANRLLAEFDEFSLDRSPVMFTGEMVYPWMFDEYSRLASLKGAADIIATSTDWDVLYRENVLAENTVPVVASVYYEDMYVDLELSMQTASKIRGCRTWVTNEYDHNAIRSDGPVVLNRLLSMLNGEC